MSIVRLSVVHAIWKLIAEDREPLTIQMVRKKAGVSYSSAYRIIREIEDEIVTTMNRGQKWPINRYAPARNISGIFFPHARLDNFGEYMSVIERKIVEVFSQT